MALRIRRQGNTGSSNDHNLLINRGERDQHPIEAITGLRPELDGKYTMPDSGIPRKDMAFPVASMDDVVASQNTVQTNVDAINSNIVGIDNRTTAIENYINNLEGEDNGVSITPEIVNAKFDTFNYYEVTTIYGQTIFDLPFEYIVGNNSLEVYIDGVLQSVNESYTESSTTQVTFIVGMYGGEKLIFKTGSKFQMNSPIHESYIYNGNPEIELDYKYNVGDNSLSVYHNGSRLDVDIGYKEINRLKVKILDTNVKAGDRLTFRRETHMSAKRVVDVIDGSYQTWKQSIVIDKNNITTITFDKSFVPNSGMLQVFCDGILMDVGSEDDYIETSENSINFNYPLDIDNEIKAVCNAGLMQWKEVFVPLGSQNRLRLSNPYNPNNDELEVYENGVLLNTKDDYNEFNRNIVVMNETPDNGSKIIIYRRR